MDKAASPTEPALVDELDALLKVLYPGWERGSEVRAGGAAASWNHCQDFPGARTEMGPPPEEGTSARKAKKESVLRDSLHPKVMRWAGGISLLQWEGKIPVPGSSLCHSSSFLNDATLSPPVGDAHGEEDAGQVVPRTFCFTRS